MKPQASEAVEADVAPRRRTKAQARGPRRDISAGSAPRQPSLEPCYAAVGRWVRRSRLRAGMTQGQLAARLGVTREWVAGVEGGFQRVMLHHVMDLAAALQDPSQLNRRAAARALRS